MKIQIYYTDVIPAGEFEERDGKMIAQDIDAHKLKYRLVWQGTSQAIDAAEQDDQLLLECVYDRFNEDDRNYAIRSLSIGDVVCLEDRYYLCQHFGWRKLAEFNAE